MLKKAALKRPPKQSRPAGRRAGLLTVPKDKAIKKRKEKPRRKVSRPESPQEIFSEFETADRKMRYFMRAFHVLKAKVGIKNTTDVNIARLMKSWRGNRRNISRLKQLVKLKTEYIDPLKRSAFFRRMIKLRLIRDPKFVQVENVSAFAHNVFKILRKCEAERKHCAMGIVDLDNFKRINDVFGHHVGDVVIDRMAERLSLFAKRLGGHAARVGGEEFRVFVPISPEELEKELNGLRHSFSGSLNDPTKFRVRPNTPWKRGRWVVPTFSAGVTGIRGKKRTRTLQSTVKALAEQSDAALYKAKEIKKDKRKAKAKNKVVRRKLILKRKN